MCLTVPLLCPIGASAAHGVREGLRPQADARGMAPGAKGRFYLQVCGSSQVWLARWPLL